MKSMLRILRNENIDYDKWDACIQASPQSRVYAYSWYLDVVSPEWSAIVWKDYEAIMPIPLAKKWGFPVIIQPLYCQQLGIFGKDYIGPELAEDFIQLLNKQSRIIKLQFNSEQQGVFKQKRANYILPLANRPENLKKAFSTNTKRNIKKSYANSCTLMEHLSIKDIMDLFRWHTKARGLKLSEKQFSTFEHLINTLISKGALDSVGVYSPVNHLCACSLFIKDGKRLYYLMSASDQMGQEYRGSFRIIDHVIHKYAGQDLILDFEGSEIPGVAKFFKGFGSTNRPFPVYTQVKLGPFSNFIQSKLQ